MIGLNEGEKIEDLQCRGLKIIQNKNWFCFGMDAVLLANYCKIENGDNIVDLGTGTGILPILIYGKNNVGKIYALEIQKEVAKLAEKSIKMNNLEEKITVLNIDIKDYKKHISKNYFDTVVTNPPYIKTENNLMSPEKKRAASKHELHGTLKDFIKTASELLKHRGKFYLVYRPDRLVEVFELMKKYKLEPKAMRLVYPKINSKPNLVLIKGIKAAKPHLIIEEPLIIFDENGEYTKEIDQIYGNSK